MTRLLTFNVEDLDKPLTLKVPNWAALASWYDEWNRDQEGDAAHNLAIACAHEPGAEGLSAIFEDGFGFLAESLVEELLGACGANPFVPIPLIPLKDAETAGVPQELVEAVAGKSRRIFFAPLPNGKWWAMRPPGSSEGARYQTESAAAARGQGSVSNVNKALVLKCVLSPSREVAEAEIDDLPGIVPLLIPSLKEKARGGKVTAQAKG